MIEYDSNTEKLEMMMVAVGRGSNSEEGDRAKQEAPPGVMGQPESRDLTSEIEVLGVARVGELGAATGSSALERRASEL